ncbi:phosphotransferase family protein [Streptomyces sp. VRA16 Mangrove soil]|uniref:phosphotransferase family protein n=1 Tax=Streptomyces sp. VRA16 Mangrove soil TaxID=2817434 RepID=UPI001A9CDDD6|nr:aminoglycoside phosphotransferase family protein [Streptomyces sp. VRA16 Mangrove soil]MBO1330758.1 aminoglycoside phosphotransferase family protein [Streptomyces sp. VRA16 Mangrove soil]
MESITKNRQSPEVLRTMIERAYGAGQVPTGDGWAEELGHGWFNVAYRIRLRDGADVVLKIAPPPHVEVMTYERGAMSIELRTLDLIRTHTSVPVPDVHFADQSHELCDADYFFMPYIDADNLGIISAQLPAAERDACMEQLGAANREINSIRGTGFGPLAGPHDPSWRRVFTGIVEDVLADGERRCVDIGWEYDTVRAVVAEHAAALDEVTEPRLVEWDLWDGNVMVRDGKIACIIDHERAFYGDPLIEAGFTGTQMSAFGDATPFLRGYGQAEPTGTEQVRRRLYCLHLMLIMVIETVFRGHTDTKQYDWARTRLDEAMALLGRTRR